MSRDSVPDQPTWKYNNNHDNGSAGGAGGGYHLLSLCGEPGTAHGWPASGPQASQQPRPGSAITPFYRKRN